MLRAERHITNQGAAGLGSDGDLPNWMSMRQIANFSKSAEAARFASYLVTQGIHAHSEQDGEQWTVWVREEDQLPGAREALAAFIADPEHARYRDVQRTAESIIRDEQAKRQASRSTTVQMRDRWGTATSARRRPLTIVIVMLCGGLALASDMGRKDDNPVLRALLFCDPQHFSQDNWHGITAEEKLVDVRKGEVWRILTPAFLHGHAMHLLFNMVMFYQLGSVIEHRRGTWRLGLMILLIAILSNLAQALAPNEWGGSSQFLGLSGVVYGLLGYAWMLSRYQPAQGIYVPQSTIVLAITFMVLGFAGVFDRVANWAHGVGFLVGYVIGIAPVVLRKAKS